MRQIISEEIKKVVNDTGEIIGKTCPIGTFASAIKWCRPDCQHYLALKFDDGKFEGCSTKALALVSYKVLEMNRNIVEGKT